MLKSSAGKQPLDEPEPVEVLLEPEVEFEPDELSTTPVEEGVELEEVEFDGG